MKTKRLQHCRGCSVRMVRFCARSLPDRIKRFCTVLSRERKKADSFSVPWRINRLTWIGICFCARW